MQRNNQKSIQMSLEYMDSPICNHVLIYAYLSLSKFVKENFFPKHDYSQWWTMVADDFFLPSFYIL